MNDIKIQAIAPLIARTFIEDTSIDSAYFKSYRQILKDKRPILGDFLSLMNGRLHDSWIIKQNFLENTFSLTISDFVTHIFAEALVNKTGLKIADTSLVFPIYIDFQLMNPPQYYDIQEDGTLTEVAPVLFTEYLDEQLLKVKNSRKIGILATTNGSDKYLLVLELETVNVTFNLDAAWHQLFGNEYDAVYNKFKNLLSRGKYLADQSICDELLCYYLPN
ncbi:hypothetical protein FHS57_006072 [Runella defluvii]|uniref:Uncharacterized protein n=1 Tax=Runella defluvii TaxID=370973 RepID=A0A7W5ZR00_9BACT|nr:hypothetical protein [Runella defluvii]MBB3842043.1 hypothetical protein [Runella defluvii]